jgi:hypothetical protein
MLEQYLVHKTEVKCFNNINKNRYAEYQRSKDSGTVPKNEQFTNKFSSSELGCNNQYLFNKAGRFTLFSTSSR